MRVDVREEMSGDAVAIRRVHERAFEQSQEAQIVDNLRRNCSDLLSLVAVDGNQILGHILFSPIEIKKEETTIQGMGLAPMAVLPEYQRKGIGTDLVREGIKRLTSQGCPFVMVLGHAEYYPRFGFEPASRYRIQSEWEVPDEAFMILMINESAIIGVSGLARYRPEFAEAM
jgi:putative acetyltransferase